MEELLSFDSDPSISLYTLEYPSSICYVSVQAKSITEERKYMAFIDLLAWYLIKEVFNMLHIVSKSSVASQKEQTLLS